MVNLAPRKENISYIFPVVFKKRWPTLERNGRGLPQSIMISGRPRSSGDRHFGRQIPHAVNLVPMEAMVENSGPL